MKEVEAIAGSKEYRLRIDQLQEQLQDYVDNPRAVSTPQALEALEKEIQDVSNQLTARLIGCQIQASLDSDEMREDADRVAKEWPNPLKSHEIVLVWIRTVNGYEILVQARYFRQKTKGRGKKRKQGFYLGFLLLGVHDRCSGAFAAEVSLLVTLAGSLAEAQAILLERGIKIGTKTIRNIAYRFSQRARLNQRLGDMGFDEQVAGRRVIVSMDGGRIRMKENKRGPKTKKKRTRYHGAWREPKLFIVYVINAEGNMERSFMPVIDATLGGPDALFKMLHSYLGQLGIVAADKVQFVADGARWIWNRIAQLVCDLGLKPAQVEELLDFYHAVEHLAKVAGLRKSWTAKQRKAWLHKHRKLLYQGKVAEVIKAVKEICRGRNSKGIRTEREYFVRNSSRMGYERMRAMKLPLGSGSVESAIRRVVNLRLKGAGMFWCKENAEAVLLLRCYWKAGRWSQLKDQAISLVPEAYA